MVDQQEVGVRWGGSLSLSPPDSFAGCAGLGMSESEDEGFQRRAAKPKKAPAAARKPRAPAAKGGRVKKPAAAKKGPGKAAGKKGK